MNELINNYCTHWMTNTNIWSSNDYSVRHEQIEASRHAIKYVILFQNIQTESEHTLTKNENKNSHFKGTVSVISSDPQFKDDNAPFLTVNPLSLMFSSSGLAQFSFAEKPNI